MTLPLLYQGPATPPDASHEGWPEWFQSLGEKLVDIGSPMANGFVVRSDGTTSEPASSFKGYSLIRVDDRDEAADLLSSHPFLAQGTSTRSRSSTCRRSRRACVDGRTRISLARILSRRNTARMLPRPGNAAWARCLTEGVRVSTAAGIVEQYQRAFGSGDARTARSMLADDLHFEGPIDQFDTADDYMESVAKLHQIVAGVDVRKVLADESNVVTIYDMHTNTPAGTSKIAEWATVENGKIVAIRVFFDARPFAAMFEQR